MVFDLQSRIILGMVVTTTWTGNGCGFLDLALFGGFHFQGYQSHFLKPKTPMSFLSFVFLFLMPWFPCPRKLQWLPWDIVKKRMIWLFEPWYLTFVANRPLFSWKKRDIYVIHTSYITMVLLHFQLWQYFQESLIVAIYSVFILQFC